MVLHRRYRCSFVATEHCKCRANYAKRWLYLSKAGLSCTRSDFNGVRGPAAARGTIMQKSQIAAKSEASAGQKPCGQTGRISQVAVAWFLRHQRELPFRQT